MELTEAQARAISEGRLTYRSGRLIPVNEGVVQSDGLTMVTRFDEAGRPIREFSGDKRSWMRPYMAEPLLMIRINQRPTDQDNARFLSSWLAEHDASGDYRPEYLASLGVR
jgi:hypothetical protein